VNGDLTDAASLAAAKNFDGVIHTAMHWSPEAGRIDESAVRALLSTLAGSAKPFLYTSGVWVMGNTGDRLAGEGAMLRPTPFVAWRPAVERMTLDAVESNVRGVVIRPAMVYGRGGGIVGSWVKQAREQGAPRVIGDGENRWSFVHVDDLADLYVRALLNSAAGELYLAAEGPAFKVKQVAEAASRAGGGGGRVDYVPLEEARGTMGPVADAYVLDQRVGSTKAGRVLGWTPRAPGVLEDLASAG
jgi:nucleoside-diphosphate-sugar epimerase